MRRTASFTLGIAVFVFFGVLMTGCEDSPTSVRDFDIQPGLESPSELSISAISSTSFSIQFQGFDSFPTATGQGNLSLEKVNESGSPSEGEQTWAASFGGQIGVEVKRRNIIVKGKTGDREITDTISVNISRDVLINQFTNDFLEIADYEGKKARSFSASGGTSVTKKKLSSETDVKSSGVTYLEIDSSPSGSATVARRTSAANADRFSLLIRPDPSTDFTLTLTFTEETGSGTAERQISFPVPAGSDWFRYQVGIEQVSSDFDPVAQRAGGNGPFLSVSMSTDKDVTFVVDELRFANAKRPVTSVHDFETTDLAYGPPFCPPTFGSTSSVANASGGFNARTVQGSGCFGYNYSGVNVSVDANDVLFFRVNSSAGSTLKVFLQADGTGGYDGSTQIPVTLPTGGWKTVAVPLGDLGDAPSALSNPGISNVGFEAGNGADFAIDDVRIESRE